MKKGLFITSAMVLLLVFLTKYAVSGDQKAEAVSQEQIRQNMHRIQIPFIANNGQMDERVTFYANTFGGTVFVTKDGEIVYALPNNNSDVETQGIASLKHSPDKIQQCRGELHSPDVIHDARQINDLHPSTPNSQTHNSKLVNSELQGIALKETLIGAKVKEIKGEDKSATKVNYFRGNDQKKWKSNISTYDVVDLGEVYKGIELKLKAYGNNVEKLFYVKPGADPNQIKINLSGIQPPDSKEKGEAAFPFIDRQPPESPFSKGDLVESLSTIGSTDASQHSTTKPLTLKESITKSPLEKGGRGVVSPEEPGTSGLWINEQGQLVAETELGPVTFTKPVAYQEIDGKRVDVAVEYTIENAEYRRQNTEETVVSPLKRGVRGVLNSQTHNSSTQDSTTPQLSNSCTPQLKNPESPTPDPQSLIYGFKVASYDKSKELVIDPLLASTYLGGSGDDTGYSIAIDASGHVCVTGSTSSSDFPTNPGVYDNTYSNNGDIFVARLSSDLKSLLAATYLGGSEADSAHAIALDNSGNVYVSGYTYSSDFPVTSGSYDASFNSEWDVFIFKLDNSLSSLQASTYLGGSKSDEAQALTLDKNDNVYVTGYTRSSDFPVTSGVYDTLGVTNNHTNVFISKLDSSLSNLHASTYLGDSLSNRAFAIALDSSSNVYVAGYTSSSNFPVTSGAYDTSYNSNDDAFISKLDNSLSSLQASTYLGGSSNDFAYGLAIDSSNNVYVTGYTYSDDFPVTSGSYDTYYNNADAFISKLDSSLSNLQASTYLGDSSSRAHAIALDSSNNVYITGYTNSSNFPTTSEAYDVLFDGFYDLFISRLDSSLTNLTASTYLGGSNYDIGYAIVLDVSNNVYVTGYSSSSDFPVTSGAYDTSSNDSYIGDVFILMFDGDLSASKPTVTTDSATNITLNSVTLNGTVNANGRSTVAWFEYGLSSGSYDYNTPSQTVSDTNDETVNVSISSLYTGTKYYYRIVAENEIGTAYGDEMSFTTLSDTTKPSGSISINSGNSYTNSTNVTLKLSASDDVGITGYYISTNSSTPSSSSSGWTSISSTTSYSASISYTL